ncbi:MAG: hypothetical protein MH204_02240 [Fimbriimonadaceae bacterium]|nr:hypothetical protein [Fimbriimonadaceae bacterium]
MPHRDPSGRARVAVFGPVRAWSPDGDEVVGLTRPTRSLLAGLVLEPDLQDRRLVSRQVWPDSEPSRALTNLRASLSRLRQALGPASIVTSPQGVSLSRDSVEADFWEFRRLARLAALKSNGPERLNLLQRGLAVASRSIAIDLEDEWLEPHRADWMNRRREALMELAEASRQARRLEDALRWAKAALELDPLDEPALALNLKILGESGLRERAARLGREAAKRHRDEINRPLPRSILDLLAEIRLGRLSRPPASDPLFAREGEHRLLAELAAAGLEREPYLVLRLAGQPIPAGMARLEDHLSLLEQVLDRTIGASEARIQAARRASGVAAALSRFERCRHWGRFVLESAPEESQTHCAMLAGLGFAAFENGEAEEAVELLSRGATLAQRHGWTEEERIARGNLASVQLHLLRLEGVLESYESALQELGPAPGLPGRSAISMNIGLYHLVRGDAEDCLAWAARALESAPESPAGLWSGWARALEALALAALDRIPEGLDRISEAVRLGYATGAVRLIETSLDHAATLLCRAGALRPGLWVRQAVAEERRRSARPHTPLEVELMRRIGGPIPPAEERDAAATNRLRGESLDLVLDFALQELRAARQPHA